jgi:hypothetical protein
MIEVANLREMCQILKMDLSTGRKHWRRWPHFFPTNGRDGRSARFVPEKVITQLSDKIEPQIEPQTPVQ